MKTHRLISIVSFYSAAVLCSCISLDKSSPTEGAFVSPFAATDLSQFNMNITLMLPDSIAGTADIHWNSSFGRLEVSAGQGIDFYITEDGQTLKEKKDELKREIFQNEFELVNENELLYTLSLPDGSVKYYNYFARSVVNGRNFTFESNPLVEFSRTDVYHMRDIIQATISFSSHTDTENMSADQNL